MAVQLKGVLFDFDDTLVDWSGVQLGWREIEAARLSRVHCITYVQRTSRNNWLNNSDSLLEAYLRDTRAGLDSSSRHPLRAPHMPLHSHGQRSSELGVAI